MKAMITAEGSPLRATASVLALALAIAGCSTYGPAPHPIYASSVPIAGRSYQVTGPALAESCQWSILGNFPVNDGDRVHDAYETAVAGGADALIDVTVDKKQTDYFVALKNCVTVEGQAIRFRPGR